MNPHPLIEYRKRRGLSRAQLAELLGVHRSMVDNVERGVRKFSAARAVEMERTARIPRHVLRPDLWKKRGS